MLVVERTLVEEQDWVICPHIDRGRFQEMLVGACISHIAEPGEGQVEQENTWETAPLEV